MEDQENRVLAMSRAEIAFESSFIFFVYDHALITISVDGPHVYFYLLSKNLGSQSDQSSAISEFAEKQY